MPSAKSPWKVYPLSELYKPFAGLNFKCKSEAGFIVAVANALFYSLIAHILLNNASLSAMCLTQAEDILVRSSNQDKNCWKEVSVS